MTIELTQGKHTIIDDEDLEIIRPFSWCYNNGYAVTNTKGGRKNRKRITMHGLIMGHLGVGRTSKKVVDHINRDKLDNRRNNLRVVPRIINLRNSMSPGNFGKGKGYTLADKRRTNKRYAVRFCGKRYGTYASPQEATAMYRKLVAEARII